DELRGPLPAQRDPSDGSLHYVLGLALLDLGKDEEARQALSEAARRTPALAAEVHARLGARGAPPAIQSLSPLQNGYA
ncbi:MAG TPA: hypothetical protein VFH47_00935, partial [Candidatus Thermoplasmatota archaeon]|nr:hypothetical protein [Candidatus Thermoplasmatota archaeon]